MAYCLQANSLNPVDTASLHNLNLKPAVSSRNNPLIKEVVVEMEKYAHYNHKITFENQNYFASNSSNS
jgi:hypothetical protein